MAFLVLKRGKEQRIQAGHLWVYAGEVKQVKGNFNDGDVVDIEDYRGKFLGRGFANRKSQIIARILTTRPEEIDAAFLRNRIAQAWKYRQQFIHNTNAYRIVYSEGDFLPGLIVDKYDKYLVVQTLTLGMDLRKETIVHILAEIFQPAGVFERNDVKVREYEGLPQVKGFLLGRFDPVVEIEENGIAFLVDMENGQKTGFFLDQRENRLQLQPLAAGARVLDGFCYSGAFGLVAAKNQASGVIGIDVSKKAIDLAQRNAQRNGCRNCHFIVGNVFDHLRAFDHRRVPFDLIILDPPAFTKSRELIEGALRGYKEINLRAMKLLTPGGYLITCSCSHHLSQEYFRQVLIEAAMDAKRDIRILEMRTQARDHPILLGVKETQYLKCFILQVF